MLEKLKSLRRFLPRPTDTTDGERAILAFRTKYAHFRNLLESNAELLQIITELQQALEGETVFNMGFLRSTASRSVFHAARIVTSIDAMAGGRYQALEKKLDELRASIDHVLAKDFNTSGAPFLLALDDPACASVSLVGGKNANLGVMARLGLPVPRGFAVTTAAFAALLHQEERLENIRALALEVSPQDLASIQRCSEAIQALLLQAELPENLAQELEKAWEANFGEGPPHGAALRSSAVGEDSELSFAGQYLSVLGVPRERLLQSYKMVAASLFTPRAISYRLFKGVPLHGAAMGVVCLEMVDSLASGVMYSRHPFAEDDCVLCNAVWGLGTYAVDGVVPPDRYLVSRKPGLKLLRADIAHKPVQLCLKQGGGVEEHPVPQEMRQAPCLEEEQVLALARYALQLEKHYNHPQDIEWALDKEKRLMLLQTRPLSPEIRREEPSARPSPSLEGRTLLLEGGETACPGAGSGPVHLVERDEDLDSFPKGGVLVAHHSSPRYVVVLQHAAAVVTEAGSVTGHMASLVREFHVPAIFNAKNACTLLEQGALVTVDANACRVFAGEVPELAAQAVERAAPMKGTSIYAELEALASLIVPLTLTDPKSADFIPANCKTLHDVMRLAHERSYEEMFLINDATSQHRGASVKLQAPLPLDLHVIDLGDGLHADAAAKRSICMEEVLSPPFKALLQGMINEVRHPHEPRPVHLGGFFSVLSEQMLRPPDYARERFGDRSYALVSDRYLNFSSRVGYHYGILDAYCGKTVSKNYVNFEFKGGAADETRRNRRVRSIAKILEALGFLVEAKGDRVTARFQKYEPSEILERLEALGRLLIFTRQMDMLMHNEQAVERAAACFLEGRCEF